MKTQLTYLGRIINKGNKLSYKYRDELNEFSIFPSAIISCAIGSIIECEKTKTGVKTPYKFIGKIEDKDEITLLTEKDWANKKEIDIQREFKKVPKTKYDEIVNDLNWILTILPRNQKLLFKMKLINDLKT